MAQRRRREQRAAPSSVPQRSADHARPGQAWPPRGRPPPHRRPPLTSRPMLGQQVPGCRGSLVGTGAPVVAPGRILSTDAALSAVHDPQLTARPQLARPRRHRASRRGQLPGRHRGFRVLPAPVGRLGVPRRSVGPTRVAATYELTPPVDSGARTQPADRVHPAGPARGSARRADHHRRRLRRPVPSSRTGYASRPGRPDERGPPHQLDRLDRTRRQGESRGTA
jgi:hypothetical protein